MKTAFVSPFTNTTNRYIELHKQLLAACGYVVHPLNLRMLVTRQVWKLMDPHNLVSLHWLETRPFRHQGAQQQLHWRGLLEFALYMLVLAVARARCIYVVHDHAVHDTAGRQRQVSIAMIKLLRKLADMRVVHDPASAERYDATYLPHPLYWDAPDAPAVGRPGHQADGRPRAMQFGLLGAVRPYKRIHTILRLWPRGVPLTIRGRSTDAYAAELAALIAGRGLAPAVDLSVGFLSDGDFSLALDQLDVLILPHADDSMLVSGAFFEAAGRVPVILARDSSFVRWAAEQLPQVRVFSSDADLVQQVQALVADTRPAHANRSACRAAAQGMFGWQACMASYRHALAAHGRAWPQA